VNIKENTTDALDLLKQETRKGGYKTAAHSDISKLKISQPDDSVNTQDDGLRNSEKDASYLAAVNRGDMETAQRMVDEAAKAAGYTVKAYHGTNAEFNIFKESSRNIGYWFTKDIDYARQHGRIIKRSFLKAANVLPEGEIWDYAEKRFGPSVSEKQIFSKDFVEYLEKNGFDGIMFDHSGANTYIVFDPNQIKSVDPVTYDDNGNVIPLSERFNENENDIRYSEKGSDIDPLEVLRKQYGTIKPGESPFRVNVEIPKKIEAHKKVSQTIRTVAEAEATPDVAMPTIVIILTLPLDIISNM